MLYFVLPLFVLTFLYAAALFKLGKGLSRLKAGTNKTQPSVSVVIAARNEEKNIESCVRAVLNQSYPHENVEIIVVDDRSEDRTADLVISISAAHRQVKLLQIIDTSSHLAPKKRAIDLGIRHAAGEIIVTTDADCQPGPAWLVELVKYFEPDVGLVAGYNPYKANGLLFQQVLALDYFAMACVAAASAGLNYPLSCSGGNLAYRKNLYLQIGGFKNFGRWVSGDDDFFLQQVRENTNWKIRYSTNPKTFVPTAPPANLKELVNQRIRYASKCAHYARPVTLGLLGVYLLNLLLVIGLCVSVFVHKLLGYWTVMFILKSCAEFLFLSRGQKLLAARHPFKIFFVTALVHPLYLVLMGLLGQLFRFQWKGHTYSAHIKLHPAGQNYD
jgi:cellulose synthase/poly-beta-1,6-N-acetylglucosamine synthase-like glycosyltransferase